MIIRQGEYTNYNGYEIRFHEVRHEAPIPFTHFILLYENEKECPIDEFEKSIHGGFIKIIKKEMLKNAFGIVTKALYRGAVFETYHYFEDIKSVSLKTYDKEIGEKLPFVKLIDSSGIAYYSGEVKLSEIEKIWEIRTKSKYDVPMPSDIEEMKITWEQYTDS
ncbi:hypothetical protein ATO12_00095 [Aquimarina atlantica]|uniref:Uncharacterized protein n=1 Tax=Aquimarina atlantica TaxID=1317122 RepID=A0A023BYS1_9FLAO|nr:hypothetical protein [Aquimarina atlantica]EZH75211.1 hypothetical protein ATO12_00095 [Aquimarina atlantica]